MIDPIKCLTFGRVCLDGKGLVRLRQLSFNFIICCHHVFYSKNAHCAVRNKTSKRLKVLQWIANSTNSSLFVGDMHFLVPHFSTYICHSYILTSENMIYYYLVIHIQPLIFVLPNVRFLPLKCKLLLLDRHCHIKQYQVSSQMQCWHLN